MTLNTVGASGQIPRSATGLWRSLPCARAVCGVRHRVWCVCTATLALVLVISTLSGKAQTEEANSLEGAKFTITKAGGLVVLPVSIGGREFSFALDTGCSVTVLDRSFRPALGESVDIARVTTLDGQELRAVFRAPAATLAQRPLTGVSEVTCNDFAEIRDATGMAIYGTLGMDFLHDKKVRIDFDRGELAFVGDIPLGSGTAISLDFAAKGVPSAALWVVGLGRQKFEIDTGYISLDAGTIETTLFTRSLDKRAAVLLRPRIGISTSGSSVWRRARLRSIEAGRFRHDGLTFGEAKVSALGTAYLSRFVVTFDFPRKRMYLLPGQHFADPTPRGLSGAEIRCPDAKMTVRSVDEKSAAERAGLQVGDVIEEIDGRPARLFNVLEVTKLFCVPGKYALTLSRSGQRFKIDLLLDAVDRSADENVAYIDGKPVSAKKGISPIIERQSDTP